MPTSTSRLSFTDCFELFDQALADPFGLAVGFEYEGDARQLRLRMNSARVLDREENAATFADQPEHPLFGRSQYDELELKLRKADGHTYILIEKRSSRKMKIIPLSEMVMEKLKPIEIEHKQVQVLRLTDRRI